MIRYISIVLFRVSQGAMWGGYFAAALGWLTSFLLPVRDFLVLTTALVFADLVTGIIAAWKRKQPIRSRAMMRTTFKTLLYFSAILATKGVEDVFSESVPITYITAFTIAITELKSILENVDVGTGSRLAQLIINKLKSKK